MISAKVTLSCSVGMGGVVQAVGGVRNFFTAGLLPFPNL